MFLTFNICEFKNRFKENATPTRSIPDSAPQQSLPRTHPPIAIWYELMSIREIGIRVLHEGGARGFVLLQLVRIPTLRSLLPSGPYESIFASDLLASQ